MKSTFRNLVPLLANRSLPLGAKVRLYSAYVSNIMLYGSEIWSAKEEGVIGRNDARMVIWIISL